MKSLFDKLSAVCSRETTKLYSTSFSLGILFLSKKIRVPVYAIYGFVRLADEIVDSFHSYPKTLLLAELQEECFQAIRRGISLNPIINSFQHAVNRYHIDEDLILKFLDSMEMDLSEQVYTEQKYEEYILGSAQVVGLMCLRIFTECNEQEYNRFKLSAMKLGSAFQKVNFLRDIKADYKQLNRTYFPDVSLTGFDESTKKAIEKEVDKELCEALLGIRELPLTCRKGVYVAYTYYRGLLKKIQSVPADEVMQKRIRVSAGNKLWLTLVALIRYNLNLI